MTRSWFMMVAAMASLALGAGPAAAAVSDACQPVVDALTKLKKTPYHLFMTGSEGANAGQPKKMESISVGGKLYINAHGRWITSPVGVDEADDDVLADLSDCKFLRDDADGALYAVHQKTEDFTSDGQIWIAKASGLPVRQEVDLDVGEGAVGKSHSSIRFDYTDVAPPAAVK
ncbi:MAG: hypothetical protein U1E52_05050 [Geminicoccaceae bacterium]